jgi:hypothetical protein
MFAYRYIGIPFKNSRTALQIFIKFDIWKLLTKSNKTNKNNGILYEDLSEFLRISQYNPLYIYIYWTENYLNRIYGKKMRDMFFVQYIFSASLAVFGDKQKWANAPGLLLYAYIYCLVKIW